MTHPTLHLPLHAARSSELVREAEMARLRRRCAAHATSAHQNRAGSSRDEKPDRHRTAGRGSPRRVRTAEAHMTTQRSSAAAAAHETCPRCAAAWSAAMNARTKQRAAEADAARARESERGAYAIAQDALDQVQVARFKLHRTYALVREATSRSHRAVVRDHRGADR
jgi:hypothetical protein